MTTWIDNVLSPLKSASSLIQEPIEVRDALKFGEAAVKLQNDILAAQRGALAGQQEQFMLTDEISGLKKRVAELEAWDAEQSRYIAKTVSPGVVAYMLKPEEQGAEEAHMFCANCFHERKISFWQASQELRMRRRVYKCHRCKSEIELEFVPRPEPPGRAVTSGYNPFSRRRMGS